jgi:hypothetical protein
MYSSLRYPLQVWPAGVALTAVTGPPSLNPLIQFAAYVPIAVLWAAIGLSTAVVGSKITAW